MSIDRQLGFNTRQLHAGTAPDPTTGSRAVPIYQTTSYQFRDTEHAANLFALKELGNIYTRIMNPTTDVLEQRLASLEGGVGALAAELRPRRADHGDPDPLRRRRSHRVSSSRLYGGTYNQFNYTLPAHGHRRHLCRSGRPGQLREGDPPEHQDPLRRDAGQPRHQRLPVRGSGRHRQGQQHPVDDRQHLCHALPVPPVRVGRQHRHPQHHQVPGRSRHRPSAAPSWTAATSTGRSGPLRQLHHARPVLSRPGVCRRPRHGPAALHHQGARPDPARHRRLPGAVQQLEHAAAASRR